MASVNKVILVGNLGRDPEVRYTPDNQITASLSVATTAKWKEKNGNPCEETEWHRVVLYGNLAEVARDFLKKGRSVYLEGKLKTRKWTDKQNVERYTTEIIASQMQMLDGNRQQQSQEQQDHGNY